MTEPLAAEILFAQQVFELVGIWLGTLAVALFLTLVCLGLCALICEIVAGRAPERHVTQRPPGPSLPPPKFTPDSDPGPPNQGSGGRKPSCR